MSAFHHFQEQCRQIDVNAKMRRGLSGLLNRYGHRNLDRKARETIYSAQSQFSEAIDETAYGMQAYLAECQNKAAFIAALTDITIAMRGGLQIEPRKRVPRGWNKIEGGFENE